MKVRPLIKWIDRESNEFPKARFSLSLILLAVWFPLMLIGWNEITLTIGIIWSAPWIALYAWRWQAMIDRLDAKSRSKKRH